MARFFGLTLVVVIVALAGCPSDMKKKEQEKITHLSKVLDRHKDDLLKIEGVVGTYIGLDENDQICIKIMVLKKTAELEKRLPKTLEGQRVVIEETGEIIPLEPNNPPQIP